MTFVHVRLGPFSFVIENVHNNKNETIVYRPINSIMTTFKHLNVTLDVIKMDIENSEWDVFEGSFFKVGLYKSGNFVHDFKS